jgi:hypothetical protein
MSNRLKFYREQMAAFEGTADPGKAIASGYYVPAPRTSPSSLLSRVALRPAAKHLLIGGIGSGKTTQLLITCNQLNDIENTCAYYIDAGSYCDISNISPDSLTVIAGLFLSKHVEGHNDDQKKNIYHRLIQNRAYGHWEPDHNDEDDIPDVPDDLLALPDVDNFTWRKGILEESKKRTDLSDLIEAITYLKNLIKDEIIFFIDGLDRIDNAKLFARIVTKDVQAISSAGIGIVLVGPLLTAYSQYRDIIEPSVNYTSYQSCFDIENDPEARIFFEKILKIRSQEGFIEQSALESLVNFSGGVLRDLISLTQSSIEEAYVSDDDSLKLKQSHVEVAADSFGRAKLLGVSDQDLEVLKKVAETGKFIPRTDEEVRLLVTGRILEYQYPAKRFSVHPILKSLIKSPLLI